MNIEAIAALMTAGYTGKNVKIITAPPEPIYAENAEKIITNNIREHNSQCINSIKSFHNKKGWRK